MAETRRKSVQADMEHVLARLGLSLRVAWTPNRNHDEHGLIDSGTVFLFDETESEAWATFTHEILEFRLKDVTKTYRTVVNALIEVFERLTYERKETFLESIPEILKTIEEQRTNSAYGKSQRC